MCQVLLTCDDLGLSKDNLLCDAALSLVQLLTDAGNDAQAVLQSVGCLLTNELTPYKIAIHDGNHGHGSFYPH